MDELDRKLYELVIEFKMKRGYNRNIFTLFRESLLRSARQKFRSQRAVARFLAVPASTINDWYFDLQK